jgi:ABC-type multidrug transport system ATPase subunit/pSer/pThr/pTyr-binding forkhead associated (FHA) protein
MENDPKGTVFLKHSQFLITWPDGREQKLPLVENVTRIGRDRSSQVPIPLEYETISRHHLEVRRENGEYILSDLDSSNGVFVNGQKVQRARLSDNDEIRIGLAEHGQEVHIRFQLGNESLLSAVVSGFDPAALSLVPAVPHEIPRLSIRWPDGQTSYFPLKKDTTLVGRSAEADLRLPDSLAFVSSKHCELRRDGNNFTIADLGSTNGTLLNNRPLTPGKPTDLHDSAIIRLGDEGFGVSLGLTFLNPLEPALPVEGFALTGTATIVESEKPVIIGRLAENDIALDAPDVSRKHASITKQGHVYILHDLESRNGTFVNEQEVQSIQLHNGDLIRIGNFILTFQDGQVTPYQSNGMRLDVNGLSKEVNTRAGKRRILENINLSVLPREFVAIVGGSGAGKSTLLNALVGIRPGDGQVQLNGHDFYAEYEHFRAQLGYVPQNDILHTSLTLEKALDYAARLRLPGSIRADERAHRISAVLDTVSMNNEAIRKTRIRDLSGGQRKRVSIAAELLSDPKLIYLDEATSGLDPGLEKKMMHTLRRMADEGRTVLLITHATDNIVQADHVAFISQGRLVFFGPMQEALDFFEVEAFADIYEKIERSGEHWQQVFEQGKSKNYQRYIQARQAAALVQPKRELSKVKFGLGDMVRQFIVLSQRTISVLFSDPVTLVLMLLLLPITGMLQLIIGSKEILTGNPAILADPVTAAKTLTESYIPFAKTNIFIFVLGLEPVLIGMFVPSNDLVKERSIYLRERMVNLRVLPYLLSKAAIYSVFAFIQVLLYLLILSIGIDFPARGLYFNGTFELFITLFLTIMSGIAFGFIISAISHSTEMAIYILTMMLFFHFFFGGTIFDLRGNTFEPLSYLTTTRWSITALGITNNLPKLVEATVLCTNLPENPLDPNSGTKPFCQKYLDARKDLMLDYNDAMLLKSWGILLGMSILFLATTGFTLKRTKNA